MGLSSNLSFIAGFVVASLIHSFFGIEQYARSSGGYGPSQLNPSINNPPGWEVPLASIDKQVEAGGEGAGGIDAAGIPTSPPPATETYGACSVLNLSTSSATSIWSEHLSEIFHASRHVQDTRDRFVWHDFTALLLNYMTPRRLQTSVKSLPSRYWDKVGEVMGVAFDRYQWTTSGRDGVEPRKVNVFVMGGSVTMGVQCLVNPVFETGMFARRQCAWPERLRQFLNALGEDVVDVNYITLGGVNTESGLTIWDYKLFPSDIPHPDVVIHAYATNDMHILSEVEAMKRNMTLEDMILEVNQKFVRAVLKPRESCEDRPSPLLLYYDDYIGNEQQVILKTQPFARAAEMLSKYYGFGLISYADAVRHLVYGDTNENWFSPHGWPNRQVHPGMGMHISSIWTIAFNFLIMATTYCSSLIDKELKPSTSGQEYLPEHGMPELRSDKNMKGGPSFIPRGMPPKLSTNLTLDNISSKWQNATSTFFDASNCKESDYSKDKPCIFSWVGGLERGFDNPKHLEKRMSEVIVTNDGWIASADNSKLGFTATKDHAVFEMKFDQVKQNVQTLTFMVMASYGEKWEGSKIRVDAYVDKDGEKAANILAKSIDIVGFHDRQTSETYSHKLDLGEQWVRRKDTLRVRIELVGGSTFKFTGMAVCDD